MKRSVFLKGYDGPYKSAQTGCRINESPDLILWLVTLPYLSYLQEVRVLKHTDMNPCVEECAISVHLCRLVNHRLSIGRIRPLKTQYYCSIFVFETSKAADRITLNQLFPNSFG